MFCKLPGCTYTAELRNEHFATIELARCSIDLQCFLKPGNVLLCQAIFYSTYNNYALTTYYHTNNSQFILSIFSQYVLNPESGLFRHHSHHPSKERNWLSSISYNSGEMTYPKTTRTQPLVLISYQVHAVTHMYKI